MGRRVFVFWLFAYAAFFLSLDGLPFLDFPNHVTRSCVIGSLYSDIYSPFHSLFTFNLQPVPYILGDLLMAATCQAFDPLLTGRIWLAIGFLLVPLGMDFWLRELRASREVRELLLLISIYLSTNWFFFSGFYNYQLGFGLALFAFALSERSFRTKSAVAYTAYCVTCGAIYFTHLAPFVCIGIVLGLSGLIRLVQKRIGYLQFFLGYIPLAGMSLLYLLIRPMSDGKDMAFGFRTFGNKIAALGSPFIRFNYVGDTLLFLGFFVVICWYYYPHRLRIAEKLKLPAVREWMMISLAMLIVYSILPVEGMKVYEIDNRAILFFVCAGLVTIALIFQDSSPSPKRFQIVAICLSALLFVNFCLISWVLVPQNREARNYIEILKALPERRTLLSVATRPDVARVMPLLHTASLYTWYRKGMTPYLFRGDMGDAMTYFRFRGSLFRPEIFWYRRAQDPIPWDQVRANFPLIVVTKPFDQTRVNLTGYEVIAENQTVVAYQRSAFSQ